MIRLLATVVLGVTTSVLIAADKYAVPPHPASTTQKCAVDQPTGQPTSAKNGTNWDVSTSGKYNYDDTWSFKSLKAEILYTKGLTTRAGPLTIITDESTIGTPGTFLFPFPNIPPPQADEMMNLKVTIIVRKTGQQDKTENHAKQVPMPP